MDIPVITGGDETGTFFMTLTMLRRLDDELEGVVHDKKDFEQWRARREML